jgi:hypothetical protein
MNDPVSLIIWFAAPVAAVFGFVVSFIRSRQRSWIRRILGGGCVALAVGISMLVAAFAWVLRDGLAPGMVVSEGGSAVAHFTLLYAVALLPVAALALPAWALLRTPHRKEVHVTQPCAAANPAGASR